MKALSVIDALTAASHALRSYQYGNASPDLAQDVADVIDAVIAAAPEAVVPCSQCGKRVSGWDGDQFIVRAFVECPECIEARIRPS